jgi:hypothetical protein
MQYIPDSQGTRNRTIADTQWRCIRESKHSSTILNLGTRWRWAVSFTPLLLYLRGNNPWYPFHRKLGGPHSRSGRYGEEKNLRPSPEIKHQFLGPLARSLVAIPALLLCAQAQNCGSLHCYINMALQNTSLGSHMDSEFYSGLSVRANFSVSHGHRLSAELSSVKSESSLNFIRQKLSTFTRQSLRCRLVSDLPKNKTEIRCSGK